MTRSVLLSTALSGLAALGLALSGTAGAQSMPHPHVPGMSPRGTGMLPAPGDRMRVDSYVVEKGDTLSGIAKVFLGDEDQWMHLAHANRIDDPSKLAVGTLLEIPAVPGEPSAPGSGQARVR